jgi:hypothetical protein
MGALWLRLDAAKLALAFADGPLLTDPRTPAGALKIS